MAEFIERSQAIKELTDAYEYEYPTASGAFDEFATTIVPNVLRNLPAADVIEVVHGEWEYDPDGTDWGLGAWRCSLCRAKNDNLGMGNNINPHLFVGSKYCPHCGAKMDGERRSENENT